MPTFVHFLSTVISDGLVPLISKSLIQHYHVYVQIRLQGALASLPFIQPSHSMGGVVKFLGCCEAIVCVWGGGGGRKKLVVGSESGTNGIGYTKPQTCPFNHTHIHNFKTDLAGYWEPPQLTCKCVTKDHFFLLRGSHPCHWHTDSGAAGTWAFVTWMNTSRALSKHLTTTTAL